MSFRILRARGIRIAGVYASDAEHPHFAPPAVDDDTLAQKLLFGETPAKLQFEPDDWMKIEDR